MTETTAIIFPNNIGVARCKQSDYPTPSVALFLNDSVKPIHYTIHAIHVRSAHAQNIKIVIGKDELHFSVPSGETVLPIDLQFNSLYTPILKITAQYEKDYFLYAFNGGEPCGSCSREREAFKLWAAYRKFFSWIKPTPCHLGSFCNIEYSAFVL